MFSKDGYLYFFDEDSEKIAKVAEEVMLIAERLLDAVDARKCPVSEMQDMEIGLMMQRMLFASIYRDEEAAGEADDNDERKRI